MNLIVNGKEVILNQATSLEEVLSELGYRGSAFAVAVNMTVVAQALYKITELVEGDQIEILTPMQGG